YDPVCGSDWRTYHTRCMMKYITCEEQKDDVKYLYGGRCKTRDPCLLKSCVKPRTCVVNNAGEPKCRCAIPCTRHWDPACGTDGHTHTNPCMLNYLACETDSEISLRHMGNCKSRSNKEDAITLEMEVAFVCIKY
ncbi:unnamed protein product, partial [Owenia fusiformis]